jgi:hypothetical protein
MLTELVAIRRALADIDASDKEEVGSVLDRVTCDLDDLIAAEEAAEAEPVTQLVDPDNSLDFTSIRWLIEHKACTGFQQCWEACLPGIRDHIIATWGSDPWPR